MHIVLGIVVVIGIFLYLRSLFRSYKYDRDEYKARVGKVKSEFNGIRNSAANIIEKNKKR